MAQGSPAQIAEAVRRGYDKRIIIESTANGFMNQLYEAINNPTPHTVKYFAKPNRTLYIPPTEFYIGGYSASPSDCEWFVPT